MERDARNLRFRTAERREIALDAELVVECDPQNEVRFARSAVGADGVIPGTMVDISDGGAGVISGQFVPRWTRLRLTVRRGATREVVLDAPTVVRRVQMLDRRPAYLLGLSFEDLSHHQRETLHAFLALLDGATESV